MKQQVTKILTMLMLIAILPFQSVSAASTQEQMISTAKSYIGVPYAWGGSSPSGFDCSGFIQYIFGKTGITLPRISEDQFNTGTKVSKADLQPGDLVFFEKTYNKAGITHSGIYIGNNQFISATSSKGIKIDSLSSSYWGPKYYGATRVLTSKPGEFQDVNNSHLAYTAINSLSSQGIINGFPDGSFRPEENITRGQAAAILNRIINKQPASLSSFSDVPTWAWYAKDVAAIKELGFINGYEDGTFRPEANMTRAEMAAILQRAFKLQNSAHTGSTYNDIDPSYWAYDAIVTVSSIDQTSLFSGDRYYAANLATRAFYTAGIYNAMNASGK